MPLIDTHAHLDDTEFNADRPAVVERARLAGVEAIICVGTSLESSRQAVQLAQSLPNIFAAVGIHPNSAAEAAEGDWACIEQLARLPRVVAVGETGLDWYRDYTPAAVQRDYFIRHLDLAQRLDLPVVIHCRDAADELLGVLRDVGRRKALKGVLHAFSGDAAMAAECTALGLHVSFAGNLTYSNRKYDQLREAAKLVPDDRLLLETDCPYLVPQTFRGKQRRNEPANVVQTAEFLAELRGMPLECIAVHSTANARRLFRL